MVPSIMKQRFWVPWIYLLPALLIMAVFIIYPMANTVSLSFKDRTAPNRGCQLCARPTLLGRL